MCWFPIWTAMKFYFHYKNEKNASQQQKETKKYRKDQADFQTHVRKNGLKINFIKDKSKDNFYTGVFRTLTWKIANKTYVSKLWQDWETERSRKEKFDKDVRAENKEFQDNFKDFLKTWPTAKQMSDNCDSLNRRMDVLSSENSRIKARVSNLKIYFNHTKTKKNPVIRGKPRVTSRQ